MNLNDRRVRKTKKALREALSELLINKELHSITVRELTDKADVHRATFYTHYQDVYDLYEQLEDSVVAELDAIIINDQIHSYNEIYAALIDYVYDNTMLCQMLFGSNGNLKFQNKVKRLLEENYLKIWLYEDGKTEITQEMRYLTTYHIQGCIAIISYWVDNKFIFPKEKVIEIIQRVNDNIDGIIG